jgi:hypothetical protein
LHRETEQALAIILFTGEFRVGTYEADEFYYREWKLVQPKQKPVRARKRVP